MTIIERVEALRQWMRTQGLGAYLIPTADPHNDEYIPAHWMCREWISGFTGSAGLAVVTQKEAVLWTDSRYWLQAAAQLDGTPYALMREGEEGVPAPMEWLRGALPAGEKAGCAAEMLTVRMAAEAAEMGIDLVPAADAFDDIWAERPALPAGLIEVQDARYTGQTATEKLARVREILRREVTGRDYIFNDLSDIAWMLNLRGSDVPYNPVFVAYLVYSAAADRFTLLTHADTLSAEARMQLAEAGVGCAPYGSPLWLTGENAKALDFATASCMLHDRTDDADFASPVAAMRAVKNEAEIEGFRQAMQRDGVAMVQFLRWLDEEMKAGRRVTEVTADERLTALRAAQPGYKELSFATIAGYGPHGAIVHYEADAASDVPLEPHGLLLLDSGAQYDCGTTDITRTIALGKPTDEEQRVYTLVLKGHLALSRTVFPIGTTGLQLDLAARSAMWAAGYDFGHGTGHGVGAHLCVHEGPHQIRKNVRGCTLVPFKPGMVVTNEPGIYVEGRFGVRIENVLICADDRTTPFGRFCRFDTLTLCPYDRRAADRTMLTDEEVEQINIYHEKVRRELLPLLTDEADRRWLETATAPWV